MTEKEKRNIILDQTSAFLLKDHSFNMSELALDLNVSRKTLYNYFGNRKNFLQLTIDYSFEKMKIELEKMIDRDLPFIDRGQMMLDRLSSTITQVEKLSNNKIIHEKQIEELYKQTYETIKSKVKSFIEEGQNSGWVRSDIPARYMSNLFFSLIIGSLHNMDPEETYENYITLIVQGLLSNEARANGIEKLHLPGSKT